MLDDRTCSISGRSCILEAEVQQKKECDEWTLPGTQHPCEFDLKDSKNGPAAPPAPATDIVSEVSAGFRSHTEDNLWLRSPQPPRQEGRSHTADSTADAAVKRDRGPLGATFSSDVKGKKEKHALIRWFEEELRPELRKINTKLDMLCDRNGGLKKSNTRNIQERFRTSMSAGSSSLASTTPKADVFAVLGGPPPRNVYHSGTHSGTAQSIRTHHAAISAAIALASKDTGSDTPLSWSSEICCRGEEEVAGAALGANACRSPRQSLDPIVPMRRDSMTREMEQAAILAQHDRGAWWKNGEIWDKVYISLEEPTNGGMAVVIHAFILFSVLITILQTLPRPMLQGVPAAVLETTVDICFLLEFLLHFVACPNRLAFLVSPYNLIDLAAAAPLALRAASGFVLTGAVDEMPNAILLLAVPVVRLLKLVRRFEKFLLLQRAFSLAWEALPVLLFMLFVVGLSFSVLMFLVEPRDNIPSLATAAWLVLVTMTTVGFGDITPQSDGGCLISCILIVVTLLYMAVPLGIIGSCFTVTWDDRDRILLVQRARVRLTQWGYTANDIPMLFKLSDEDEDGDLDATEFRDLLTRMKLGLSDDRIYKLYRSVVGNAGTLDAKQFVRTLFPDAYHHIYTDDDENTDYFSSERSKGSSAKHGPGTGSLTEFTSVVPDLV